MEKTSLDSRTTNNPGFAKSTASKSQGKFAEAITKSSSVVNTAEDDGPVEIQIEFELGDFFMQPSQPLSSQPGEELEMIGAPKAPLGAQLPDAKLETGAGLMRDLEAIPEKMAFKIGEAAEMVGVKQYVLRYWESEFEMLRPRKSKNNQRVYSRRDVETAMMIKKLLYEDRFSIEGARTALKSLKAQVKEEKVIKAKVQSQETRAASAVAQLRDLLGEIRRVREIFC